MAERNHVMEVIAINRENQTAFEQLKQEKSYYRGRTKEPQYGLCNAEGINIRHCSSVGLQ